MSNLPQRFLLGGTVSEAMRYKAYMKWNQRDACVISSHYALTDFDLRKVGVRPTVTLIGTWRGLPGGSDLQRELKAKGYKVEEVSVEELQAIG